MNYKHLNLHEHCLHRPDTYIGSVRPERRVAPTANEAFAIADREVTAIPAIHRMFDEAVSNAMDNVWRGSTMGCPVKSIRVSVDAASGRFTVENDGLSIPVRRTEDDSLWIPEMLFGKLLTSSNYDDEEERLTGGRNGLGISLTNVFSSSFAVRVVDPGSRKSYEQEWSDNMRKKSIPKIRVCKSKGLTRVSWVPDAAYFGREPGFGESEMGMFRKVALDASLYTGVKLFFNEELVPAHSLLEYARCWGEFADHLDLRTPDSRVLLVPHRGFSHVSMVNGICTPQGGAHVTAWADAVFPPIAQRLSKALKTTISAKDVKGYFRIFVVCTLPNPEFGSQTKLRLTAPAPQTYFPPAKLKAVCKWAFVESLRELAQRRELQSLKNTERKRRNAVSVDGHDPANKAGTKDAANCALILCEGLSAKTYAVIGIQEGMDFGNGRRKGRDWFGILPLRGKVLNTRNVTTSKVASNQEITNIVQVLGLRHGCDYSDDSAFATLRYGRVVLLCDSDVDGYHIQGLLLNMLDHLFPSLLRRRGFLFAMETPIVKAVVGKQVFRFYSLSEAQQFLSNHRASAVQYYKGLGTSSDRDVRETFGRSLITYGMDGEGEERLDMAFSKTRATERKKWLARVPDQVDPQPTAVDGVRSLRVCEFVDCQLVQFSIDDCKRSLPSVLDGLKESQRKVLFTCLAQPQKTKVAQLAGKVATLTQYHHGEQCLFGTIINLAQDFVGSNNLPLLQKEGQFGTRLSGGKDAASARYIYVSLAEQTRRLFPKEDDDLLPKQWEDGEPIEPGYYLPVLPMILVNGVSSGIGTGWSTSIPSFSPSVLAAWIRAWLEQKPLPTLVPWYRGFRGDIRKTGAGSYETRGLVRKQGKQWVVSELPVGMWTDRFADALERLVRDKKVKKVRNHSTPESVQFDITLAAGVDVSVIPLTTTISARNMVAFSADGSIRKYGTVEDILEEFCRLRLRMYEQRKRELESELARLATSVREKRRFVEAVVSGKLEARRLGPELLEKRKFARQNGSFAYLLDLPLRSLHSDRVVALQKREEELTKAVARAKTQSAESLWVSELNEWI